MEISSGTLLQHSQPRTVTSLETALSLGCHPQYPAGHDVAYAPSARPLLERILRAGGQTSSEAMLQRQALAHFAQTTRSNFRFSRLAIHLFRAQLCYSRFFLLRRASPIEPVLRPVQLTAKAPVV